MRYGVLGTGVVGRTIAARLVELHHDVMMGTRDPSVTLKRNAPDRMGNAPFPQWQQQHPQVRLGTFAQAVAHGELIVNATSGAVMVNPRAAGRGDHTAFLSGNDAGAKTAVADLLRSFGWKEILDLGDISTARGAEMYLPIWLRLWGAVGSPMFNIKIVR